MKVVIFKGPGRIGIEEAPEPRLQSPTDAIVRVTTAALCGSELPYYRGQLPREGGGSGHEFAGTVVNAGDAVTRVNAGQRVVSAPSVACGGCIYCMQGRLGLCERQQTFGRELPGALAELVRVPNADTMLEKLPDDLPDDKAIFASHLLTGVYAALTDAGLKAGDSVAVMGCGPAGLCSQLMARTMGASQVFGIDHHAYRLDAAARLGSTPLDFDREAIGARVRAATDGRGADIAVEAVGDVKALADGVELVRRGGTLLSLGTDLDRQPSFFPIGNLAGDQVRLVPAGRPAVKNHMAAVLKLLAAGAVDPTPIITHRLSLADAPRGFEMMAARSDGALKVLLTP
jgi:threonine dehydrogenase-like Zn-dependent dehydrogenase